MRPGQRALRTLDGLTFARVPAKAGKGKGEQAVDGGCLRLCTLNHRQLFCSQLERTWRLLKESWGPGSQMPHMNGLPSWIQKGLVGFLGCWWSDQWAAAAPTPSSVSFPTPGGLLCRPSITTDGLVQSNHSSPGTWADPPLGPSGS